MKDQGNADQLDSDSEPNRSAPDGGPYPDPRSAFTLTVGAFFGSVLVSVFFIGLGTVVAIGVGQAIAVGTIATLAAKRVSEPQAERIGLRALDLRTLPIILCLVPAILLASELDNIASDFSPAVAPVSQSHDSDYDAKKTIETEPGTALSDDASASMDDPTRLDSDTRAPAHRGSDTNAPGKSETEDRPLTRAEEEAIALLEIDLDDPWTIAQAFVISVGITPIIEEFFFRGVLQQGLVARLGLIRGVGFVALLYTLPHLPAVATLPRFLIGLVSTFGIGCLLGLVRIATGSILGSMLLASLTASVGIFSFAMRERWPLPGMNVDGTHLPATVTFASILIVGWAAQSVYNEAKNQLEAEREANSANPLSEN